MDTVEIYKSIREKIIWLELMPETIINMSTLAKSFGVSRTPIKEALILLQAEGWILRHEMHYMVTPLSLNRIKELTEMRLLLEIQANVWAMNRITHNELGVLSQMENKILKLGHNTTNKNIVELDVQFHRTLFNAAKNSQLAELLDRLLSHYLRFWLFIQREIDPKEFFSETIQIIGAIREKDEASLRSASAMHINKSINEIMSTF